MGAISIILSDQLVSGFSCGAAVHVVVSQIPSVLEIKAHKIKNIPFAVFYVSKYFFYRLIGIPSFSRY